MYSNNTMEGTVTIDDVTQQPNPVEGDDNNVGTSSTTTSLPIVINDNDQSIPIVAMEDVWATSAGYTPLQDFMINHHHQGDDDNENGDDVHVHGAFFSDGVNGGTIYTSLPGAFYANIGYNNNGINDNTWDREEEDDGYQDYNYLHDIDDDDEDLEATMATTSSTSLYDSEDFRSVADNALLMLDREYHHVVSQEPLPILPPLDSSTDIVSVETKSNELESHINDGNTNDLARDKECDTKSTVEQQQQQNDQEQQTQPKIIPKIDTEAVRRAVQTIQLKNPQFEENLRLWESKQLQPKMGKKLPLPIMYENKYMSTKNYKMAPRLHPIIPEIPLKAFRTGTVKAIQATANLTRSACIAEALHRFNILQYHVGIEQTVRIHILGCDHVECGYHNSTCNGNQCDIMQIRTIFGPIVRWMGAYAEAPSHIRIDLIGPNIPQNVARATATEPIDLLPTKNCSSLKECLQSATLRCHAGVYENVMNDTSNDLGQPDLIIAFNAGIWGYQEWATTIKYLIERNYNNNSHHQTIPFIVTAYTIEEAEVDYDTISDIVDKCKSIELQKQVQCVWDVEQNSFASHQTRTTTCDVISTTRTKSTDRRENLAWQAWRL